MITIGDVLAYEYDSPQRLTLDDVAKAAIDSGLATLFQEWHEENDQSSIDISIRYAGNLQTEIVVTVNGREVAREFGWHIQRALAAMFATLDCVTEDPAFADALLTRLMEKEMNDA